MAHENANAQPQSNRLIFAKGTDVGRKRGHNEDYVDAFRPSDPDKRRQKGELFIVADGMGGHQAGEVASENAVEAISHEYYASSASDVRGALLEAVQRANTLIYRLAQESPSRAGMGTTAVAAVIRGQELHLANVGDSRGYLLRNGKLAQVTRDHSFVQDQIEAGILTQEEARTHPQRNVVTRALGSKPDVKVDTFGGKLQPGDTLLLCSDGLSEHVQDDDIAAILGQYAPKDAVPRLIALANQRGGSDNITALVIQVGASAGVAAAAPAAVAPGQAAPTAPSKPDKADQGLSIPLIAGLSAGGLIVVAALVVGLVFLGPRFLWGDGEETPQPTTESMLATATLRSPSPTSPPPTATLASSAETSTPEQATGGSGGAPTSTPNVGLRLLEPENGMVVTPGTKVTFRWEAPGTLPEPYTFRVMTDQTDPVGVCAGQRMTCGLRLPQGRYQWWVELWSGNARVAESERWAFAVEQPTATDAPTPTSTQMPPTDTPTSDDGDDGGDDGGGLPLPTEEPTATSLLPTVQPTTVAPTEKPTPPPP